MPIVALGAACPATSFVTVCSLLCHQTKLEMQKALEQDSSVYEYDSVYDDIQKQRLESNQKILGGTDKRVSLKFLFEFFPKYFTKFAF